MVGEVSAFLMRERGACIEAGIAPEAIALDPGFGFGKGTEHNLALLKELAQLAALRLAAAGGRVAQEFYRQDPRGPMWTSGCTAVWGWRRWR